MRDGAKRRTERELPARVPGEVGSPDLGRRFVLGRGLGVLLDPKRALFVHIRGADTQSDGIYGDVPANGDDDAQSERASERYKENSRRTSSQRTRLLWLVHRHHVSKNYQKPRGQSKHTHLTAGARFERFTIPKPAARTAALWSNPSKIRRPTGIDSISTFPMSRTRNETQSVSVRRAMNATRNQVWCEGKR